MKKIYGIIMESNPFHNGHQYLINQIKDKLGANEIIAVTSTSFNMRGEISVINKFDKTNYLLEAGCNLVMELPISKTLQSGDYFAFNAVKILNDMQVTDIACGTPYDDESNLVKLYEITSSITYQQNLKEIITKDKLSLKKASSEALKLLNVDSSLIDVFNDANFTLAFAYYKAIKDNNFKINLHLIKRVTDNTFPSARSLISDVRLGKNVDNYLPFKENLIDIQKAESNLDNIFKYHLLFDGLDSDPEGISNYLKKGEIDKEYNEYISKLANAKLSISRLKRTTLKRILKIQELNDEASYLRILGFDEGGKAYLNTLPKDIKNQCFSSSNEQNSSSLDDELSATKLYMIITKQYDLLKKETMLPIKKGTKND